MNVLSLFDGMSCGRIALDRAGVKVTNYFASEIDKHAVKVSRANWSDITHVGDVTKIDVSKLPKIDLLIGGSPCQGFSLAGKQLAFDDPRSILYFEYERILNELKVINPDIKFLLENVKMKQEFKDVITSRLGTEPVSINSNLVSAQNRPRLYWTNISDLKQPEDAGVHLKDILQSKVDEKYNCLQFINKKYQKMSSYLQFDFNGKNSNSQSQRVYLPDAKSGCIATVVIPKVLVNNKVRRLTSEECEKLQTVPVGYTSCVSDSQRYKMLGNGWTVDVIAHIFKGLPNRFFA